MTESKLSDREIFTYVQTALYKNCIVSDNQSDTAIDFIVASNNPKYSYFEGKRIVHYLKDIIYLNKIIYCLDFNSVINDSLENRLTKQALIDNILKYKKNCSRFGKKFIFMIEAIIEAPTYRYNFNHNFFNDFLLKIGIPKEEILIFSASYHQYNETKYAHAMDVAFFHVKQDTTPTFTKPVNYHFISLARIAKIHRISATLEIFDRNLNKFGNCSLGSGYHNNPIENHLLQEIIPEKYKGKFPLYIDGEVVDTPEYERQFDTSHPFIEEAFINLVMETSFEHLDYDTRFCVWNVQLVSEKTIKAFCLKQVPIFIGHSNSLQKLRDLGFDLFDDIIDHSYDLELNIDLKIKKAIDQLEKICGWSIDDCRKYKQDNAERFEKNYQLCITLSKEIHKTTLNNLQKALDSYDV